jgi:hypothetical protein
MTLSITISKNKTLGINDTYHNVTSPYAEFHYGRCLIFYCYAESRYAKCRYTEHHYAECRGTYNTPRSSKDQYNKTFYRCK